jgi:hypothetical protein
MPRPKKPKKRKRLPRIPSQAPAARDEGPRLIPLDIKNTEHSGTYHVQLADILLGRKKGPKFSRVERAKQAL